MNDEPVNADAGDGLPATVDQPRTAAEKIALTLRELSKPDPEAEPLELTLASVAMALEGHLDLDEQQDSGELDGFMLALTRFLAWHRSDSARQLVVVELPHYTVGAELGHGRTPRPVMNLPAATRLRALDEAVAAAQAPANPLR